MFRSCDGLRLNDNSLTLTDIYTYKKRDKKYVTKQSGPAMLF